MIQRFLVQLLEIVAGICLISMVTVVSIGVLDRFLLQVGLPWPEEAARFLLIWLSFLSAALAVTTKGHYVVDLLYRKLFPDVRRQLFVQGICHLLSMLVAITLLLKAGELVQRVSWQLAPALEFSMGWAYVSIPAGLFFVAFFYLVELLDVVSGAKSGRVSTSPE